MEVVNHVAEQLHHHHHIPNFKLKEKKQLSLENYLDYLHSGDLDHFTVDHLNMIVSIHGYKKLAQKKKAEEAVKAIELIDPARSTLNDDTSSSTTSVITFDEVMKDLKSLNWQECSITSIKSIKPQNSIFIVSPSTKSAKSKSLKTTKKANTKSASSMSSGSGPSYSSSSGNHNVIINLPAATAIQSSSHQAMKRRKLDSLTTSDCSGPSNNSSSSGNCSSSSLVAGGQGKVWLNTKPRSRAFSAVMIKSSN